ncbi:hypothetical protein [Oenococcus kitaharae]|uniref:Uncharacterized protein n=1 Tax=Oenococcus kitaharae DSM 17330 TaxID=1045004 RepID=G9WG85_9LACO|nr:hypothetical protein [Oenococcus kitaharae]EHN59693.1 hypothetical protein OKIT_1616 [Oenococcus kitaharae DSM 17330]OEY83527.1 hypothetical protein NT95_05285 [Oenococcus kitaharae]OEY85326.1 hypothetical protein NT96_01730 [Oenococcus kitaharae]OEY86180.1 hypothetical protein NV75_01680 [Oenococcus kitaharae]
MSVKEDKANSLKEHNHKQAPEAEEKEAQDQLKLAKGKSDQLLSQAEKKLYALKDAAKDKISEINK